MSNAGALRAFFEKIAAENLPKVPLFTNKLRAYMEEQKKKIPFLHVPWMLRKCSDFLVERGLQTEGLFRVPGSHSTVEKLVSAFESGSNPNFDAMPAFVEDVSGALKKYFRDLPEPLLSDGTPEDKLQHQVKQAVAMDDDNAEKLGIMSAVLSNLPAYNKAIVHELFYLLSRVAAHAEVNLMSSDNLATIFGGMGDFMTNMLTATERTEIVKLMIDHFETLFDNLHELRPRPNDPSLDSAKEALRVYLVDGTYKAMICAGNETAKQVASKTMTKLQQQLDMDCSKFQLWEVRDRLVRPIGDDEKILPIQRSQSAIVFTDKLTLSEKPITPRGASGSNRPRKATLRPGKDSSSSRKSSRPSRSDDKDKERPAKLKKEPTKTKLKDDKDPKSPRSRSASTATPPTGELGGSFNAWVFVEIPAFSTRASDWDTERTCEGELVTIQSENGPFKVKVKVEGAFWDFEAAKIRTVDDSTRYFIMYSQDDSTVLGVGFETRDDASKFKSAIQPILTNLPRSFNGRSSAAALYFSGPLDADVIIEDGFYDIGPQRESEGFPYLKDVMKRPLELGSREVVLINAVEDPRLARIAALAQDLVGSVEKLPDKLRMLALFVSNVMGGTDISAGLCSLEEEQEEETTAEFLSNRSIDYLKKKFNSNIVKIGQISHGTSRHRALLFKYICDRLKPRIPVALLRSDSNKYDGEIAWNYVAAFHPHQYVYIDLIHDPGRLYQASSEEVNNLLNILHGQVTSLGDVTADLPPPAALDIQTTVTTRSVALPSIDVASKLVVHELIGTGPNARVFRANVGPVMVALKEFNRPFPELTALTDTTAERAAISHNNIAACFGYDYIEPSTFRFLLEYSRQGSIASVLKHRKPWLADFPVEHVWWYAHQVATGLAHLHSSSFCHGLLKASNVLVDGPAEPYPSVKLSDIVMDAAAWKLFGGDEDNRWFAPEVLAAIQSGTDDFDTKAADAWSFGMFLVELVTLRKPYPGMTNEERVAMIKEGALPGNVPAESPFKELITRCCSVSPASRPSAAQLVELCAPNVPSYLLQP